MSIHLKNTSSYIRKKGNTKWWSWKAYIECDNKEELDSIEFIQYQLHPTFKYPIRRIWQKEGGFPLETIGWGTFELKANVFFKDKEKKPILLKHMLEFEET